MKVMMFTFIRRRSALFWLTVLCVVQIALVAVALGTSQWFVRASLKPMSSKANVYEADDGSRAQNQAIGVFRGQSNLGSSELISTTLAIDNMKSNYDSLFERGVLDSDSLLNDCDRIRDASVFAIVMCLAAIVCWVATLVFITMSHFIVRLNHIKVSLLASLTLFTSLVIVLITLIIYSGMFPRRIYSFVQVSTNIPVQVDFDDVFFAGYSFYLVCVAFFLSAISSTIAYAWYRNHIWISKGSPLQ
eukprot:ANDGO_00882.mRNA.1 hypothetical protein